jgi:hypothetical protein
VRKALVTFASGPAARLLAAAFPNLHDYAQRHDYEIVVGTGASEGRPPSWGKVPLLQRLLASYEFVLWIDADAIFLDASIDIETVVPKDAYQAFAKTSLWPEVGGEPYPCLGVWALRAGERTQRFLAAVWEQEDLSEHRWWEQAAAMRLLGWTTEFPPVKVSASEWDEGTFVLDEEWDMLPVLPIGYSPGRIRHYADWSYRRRAFDMGTDLAALRGARARHWAGLLERRLRPYYRPITGELRNRLNRP